MSTSEPTEGVIVAIRAKGSTRRRIVLLLLAMPVLGFAACGSGGSTEATKASETGTGSEVVMRLIAYKPAALEVPTGATVTWKQQDAGFHTVTSGTVTKEASGSVKLSPDGTFDSGELAKGDEFKHTFDEPGTFEYFCEIHPATMSGDVVVG